MRSVIIEAMKKSIKFQEKCSTYLLYIIHEYFFWNFILREHSFIQFATERGISNYGDCITQEKDFTFYPDDRRKYLETYFIFFNSANSGKYASAVI